MTPVRVLICDDHALVRAGLAKLLEGEEGIDVVGEAAGGEDCIRQTGELHPDVVLLDVVMPGRSGIEVLPEVLASSQVTKVLVLSMQDDPAYVREAFTAGANGYLLKEAADSELVQAIHDVATGRRYVHPILGARLAAAETAAAAKAKADPLSEREHEVLRLLALGHTNQEIAKLLFISIRTAETHRARIMTKLGLRSRAEIVRYALATGALELDQLDAPRQGGLSHVEHLLPRDRVDLRLLGARDRRVLDLRAHSVGAPLGPLPRRVRRPALRQPAARLTARVSGSSRSAARSRPARPPPRRRLS